MEMEVLQKKWGYGRMFLDQGRWSKRGEGVGQILNTKEINLWTQEN